MDKEVNLDFLKAGYSKEQLYLFYIRNKKLIIPVVIIIICFFLFMQVIMVQVQDFFLIKEEEKILQARINLLKKNLSFLSMLDEDNKDSEVKTLVRALPLEKDYVMVLNTINKISGEAGVDLTDYSFSVGDLSTPSAGMARLASIKVTLNPRGKLENSIRFLDLLAKSFPLANIRNTAINLSRLSTEIHFYYKPLSPGKFDYYKPAASLSGGDQALLNELSSWQSSNFNYDYNTAILDMLDSETGNSGVNNSTVSAQTDQAGNGPF